MQLSRFESVLKSRCCSRVCVVQLLLEQSELAYRSHVARCKQQAFTTDHKRAVH
jgi:hypothetical protein